MAYLHRVITVPSCQKREPQQSVYRGPLWQESHCPHSVNVFSGTGEDCHSHGQQDLVLQQIGMKSNEFRQRKAKCKCRWSVYEMQNHLYWKIHCKDWKSKGGSCYKCVYTTVTGNMKAVCISLFQWLNLWASFRSFKFLWNVVQMEILLQPGNPYYLFGLHLTDK